MIPRILFAMPCERSIPFATFQSALHAVRERSYDLEPFPLENTVIHLARHHAIETCRQNDALTHLLFADSDQVFTAHTVTRLLSWKKPVIAPVIVMRQGEPYPVAYRYLPKRKAYRPMTKEVVAYYDGARTKSVQGPEGILPRKGNPLLKVDAVGAGMVLIERTALLKIEPDKETGLFTDFARLRGEDFSLMEKFRAAKVPIYVDRSCWVGHLTNYVRGMYDLLRYARA